MFLSLFLTRGLTRKSQIISRCVHTSRQVHQNMKVVVVPALSDNFSYLVVDQAGGSAFAVVTSEGRANEDPVEPEKTLAAAKQENVTITHALTTHHHLDHAGGNEKLAGAVKGVEVVGGDDRIPAMNKKVKDGDTFKIGSINIKVFFTPCHTSGHVLYLATKDGEEAGSLFTGDTLFVGGCGRFFEGTGEQMHHALNKVIAGLPDNTKVYCGHEYTKKNLEFALSVEPNNAAIKKKLEWAKAQLQKGAHTIPSTVGEEKQFNPFMRVENEAFVKSLKLDSTDPIVAMDHLRNLKNNF